MVLVFLRFSVNGEQISLDVDINGRVIDVKQVLARTRNIALPRQRLIFGGRILKDDNTLRSYNIQKECSIQVFVTGAKVCSSPGEKEDEEKQSPSEAGSGPVSPSQYDRYGRQEKAGSPPTPSLEFGDLVLVQLLEAQNLKKPKFWSRALRPYVILAVGNNSSRSKVIAGKTVQDGDGRWDEMFGFRMDTSAHTLNALVFGHDDYRPDKFIGSAEFNLSALHHDGVEDVWLNLDHSNSRGSRIHIQLRRSILASPSHHEILSCLMEMERSWTSQDLARLNITLHQLIGRQAWTTEDMHNPVIEHLIAAVCSRDIRWTNGTLRRVESILLSQNMLPMRVPPTTHIYLSGLCIDDESSEQRQNGCTRSEFIATVKEYVNPKYCYISPSTGKFSYALMSFKTIREALMALVVFQCRKLPEHVGNAVMLGFGRQLPCRVHHIDSLRKVQMAGFLNVFGLDDTGWKFCWVSLEEERLTIYSNLDTLTKSRTLNVEDCILCSRGRNSLELHESEEGRSTFLYCHSTPEMEAWVQIIRATRDGKKLLSNPRIEKAGPQTLCHTCEDACQLEEVYTCDKRENASCVDCLRKEILGFMDERESKKLTHLFTVQDLRELLSTEEFTRYLEMSLEELVNTSEVYVKCPSCNTAWEFVGGSEADAPDFDAERGIDGRRLSEAAQSHYLGNRLRCRNPTCDTIFCRSCKDEPYHTGFDCATYQIYKHARHCRFCNCALMPDTKCKEVPSKALEDTCNSPMCMEKMDQSCVCMLSCGHPCHGVRDEQNCLICMDPECLGNCGEDIKQSPDDDCAICFSEQLDSAPAIQLDCSHIFHYECVKKRLEAKWPGPAISFGFVNCPLCGVRMTHELLSDEDRENVAPLSDVKKLYKNIEKQAYEKAKDENLLNDKDLVEEEGEYYQDPSGYARKKLAFYMCHRCRNPYYGGMARCIEAAVGFSDSDFICPACSGIGQDTCPIHGKEFVQYKCRFCCSVSTYFCWGTTHFCEDCHRRQEAHDYMTTKSAEDLPQCGGPDKCPLKVKHPPNGEEYSLGCAMCRGGDVSNVQQVTDSSLVNELPIP